MSCMKVFPQLVTSAKRLPWAVSPRMVRAAAVASRLDSRHGLP